MVQIVWMAESKCALLPQQQHWQFQRQVWRRWDTFDRAQRHDPAQLYYSSDDDTVLETAHRTACVVKRPGVGTGPRTFAGTSVGGHKPSAVAEADADVNTEGESESESEVVTGSDSGRDGRSVACPAAVCRIAVVRACDGRVLSAGSGCLLDPQLDPELCPASAALSLMHQSRAWDETKPSFVEQKSAGNQYLSTRLERCSSSSPCWPSPLLPRPQQPLPPQMAVEQQECLQPHVQSSECASCLRQLTLLPHCCRSRQQRQCCGDTCANCTRVQYTCARHATLELRSSAVTRYDQS